MRANKIYQDADMQLITVKLEAWGEDELTFRIDYDWEAVHLPKLGLLVWVARLQVKQTHGDSIIPLRRGEVWTAEELCVLEAIHRLYPGALQAVLPCEDHSEAVDEALKQREPCHLFYEKAIQELREHPLKHIRPELESGPLPDQATS